MLCFICNIMCKNFLTFNYIISHSYKVYSIFLSICWLAGITKFTSSIRFQQLNKETQTEREREVKRVSGK